MDIFAVHIIYHLLGEWELGVQKLHGIPQIVGVPILPVHNNAVEGHTRSTILVDHLRQFLLTLVALATLPEAIAPQGEHGHIACQLADEGQVAVGRAAIHEVVVDAVGHLRVEGKAVLRRVVELCGRVVVPVEGVALQTLEDVLEVLQVRLHHAAVLAALVHLVVLHETDAVYGFIGL